MKRVLAAAITMSSSVPASAETELWSQMASEDLSAARALIAANHPGAAEQHGDTSFLRRLSEGYAAARRTAEAARDYRAYRASLLQFAASFDDGHVWSNGRLRAPYAWPGFLVALSDSKWRVLPHELQNGPPAGAVLVSCDGKTPEAIAAGRLGPFITGWSTPARRKTFSIRLLVDWGETPFEPYDQCRFRSSEGQIDHEMEWRQFSAEDYGKAASAARPRPAGDHSLTHWREGWWIRLSSLSSAAGKVVEQAVAHRQQIVNSPYVVLDLRGNGGGNSEYTDRLAHLLLGSQAVEDAEPQADEVGGNVTWRTSPGNLQTLRSYAEKFADTPAAARAWAAQRDSMARALQEGRPFSTSASEDEDSKEARFERPDRPPQVILLTDRYCFSSCLLATDQFRRLGALHVGQPTDSNTHYSEVREIVLPSGLSTFSTLQAFIPSMPMRIGPYSPRIPIPDSVLANEERLQQEVASLVASSRRD